MNSGGKILADMAALIRLFSPHLSDRTTLGELQLMLEHEDRWPEAHALFGRIRAKTLLAERSQNRALACQYLFEEICAKSLYNLSDQPAPFDADSPYWIIPNAITLARALGLPDFAVINLVAA
jgi:hypothetical protein